ncbi:MAG: M28 family peptidase [Planctomycetaceae bacterium]|nr:M28 family peptidase [Planctomycetaceae bacterium]
MVRMPGRSYRGTLPPADEELLILVSELSRHVTHLAEVIGERNVRFCPQELAQAREYIESQFAEADFTVARQEYDVDGVNCANLEVEIVGASKPQEIVVIGAHYDSVAGCPAANDNASGIAAVLSLARTFSKTRPDRTLRFVAFVNEEEPYAHTGRMGSWVYARRCRERREEVVAMLSLETIGYYCDAPGSQKYPPLLHWIYPSAGNFIAFIGNTRYSQIVRQVTGTFRRSESFPSEGGALPEAMSDIGRSDHWPFWQEGYPALMVTDTAPFRYKHYHTPDDTVDKIDFEKMARVVRGLRSVVEGLVLAE